MSKFNQEPGNNFNIKNEKATSRKAQNIINLQYIQLL